MSVLVPALVNVIEQDPAVATPEQDSPVLAVTVTNPVGPAPAPDAEKLIVTACWSVEGFGAYEVIEVVVASFTAAVFCIREAD